MAGQVTLERGKARLDLIQAKQIVSVGGVSPEKQEGSMPIQLISSWQTLQKVKEGGRGSGASFERSRMFTSGSLEKNERWIWCEPCCNQVKAENVKRQTCEMSSLYLY